MSHQARILLIFEADPEEIAAKQTKFIAEDIIIEPEILHFPSDRMLHFHSDSLPFVSQARHGNAGQGLQLDVHVKGQGQPVEGCRVFLYLRGTQGRSVEQLAVTPNSGNVSFAYGPSWQPTMIAVFPPGGYWDSVVRGPQATATINLTPLPTSGPLAWWHNKLGIHNYEASRGQGIRVGVIDTGVKPHSHLNHITDVGSFLQGQHNPSGGGDVDSHGSHVCGTIAAIPEIDARQYAGIAPGVELYSARVFPPASGANQADIAQAIDYLTALDCDLINLSLGAKVDSQIERDAIVDALENGTLCICAAGNSNSPVQYPAAFPETIAVAALGMEGWGHEGSLTATRYPTQRDRYGHHSLYLANFSCYGSEIDCCAPGVGIISSVPERFGLIAPSVAMDGTSMASPMVCGALSCLLAQNPEYLALPRDIDKAEKAREILKMNCVDIGLALSCQGRGLIRVVK